MQVVQGPHHAEVARGHTMRICGAWWLARSGVLVPQIQTFAWWASPAVMGYTGEAHIEDIGAFMRPRASAVEPQDVEAIISADEGDRLPQQARDGESSTSGATGRDRSGTTETPIFEAQHCEAREGPDRDLQGRQPALDHQPVDPPPYSSRRASWSGVHGHGALRAAGHSAVLAPLTPGQRHLSRLPQSASYAAGSRVRRAPSLRNFPTGILAIAGRPESVGLRLRRATFDSPSRRSVSVVGCEGRASAVVRL